MFTVDTGFWGLAMGRYKEGVAVRPTQGDRW